MQGKTHDCTKDIVKKYKEYFPETKIILSTWTDEDIKDIPCEIIQIDSPEFPTPFHANVNHQKMGALAGLKEMSCDIIMKCRTDQLIQNKKIFQIYQNSCPKEKIMSTNWTTWETIDYAVSDFCQITTRDILVDYWNSIAYYDGSYPTIAEVYLASNYIIRGKNDLSPWKSSLRKYYFIKDVFNDFEIEWERMKFNNFWKEFYDQWLPYWAKPD